MFTAAERLQVARGVPQEVSLDVPPASRAWWRPVDVPADVTVAVLAPTACAVVPAWIGRVPVQSFTVTARRPGRHTVGFELCRPFSPETPLQTYRLLLECSEEDAPGT